MASIKPATKDLPRCSLTRRNAYRVFRCFQELCHCNRADLWSCFHSSNLVQFAQRSGGCSLYNALITHGSQVRHKGQGKPATTRAASFSPNTRLSDKTGRANLGSVEAVTPRESFSLRAQLYLGCRLKTVDSLCKCSASTWRHCQRDLRRHMGGNTEIHTLRQLSKAINRKRALSYY